MVFLCIVCRRIRIFLNYCTLHLLQRVQPLPSFKNWNTFSFSGNISIIRRNEKIFSMNLMLVWIIWNLLLLTLYLNSTGTLGYRGLSDVYMFCFVLMEFLVCVKLNFQFCVKEEKEKQNAINKQENFSHFCRYIHLLSLNMYKSLVVYCHSCRCRCFNSSSFPFHFRLKNKQKSNMMNVFKCNAMSVRYGLREWGDREDWLIYRCNIIYYYMWSGMTREYLIYLINNNSKS